MKRRFCMVTTFYPPYNFGGDGVYVERLAGALARRGDEVHVVHDVDAYRLLASEPAAGAYRYEGTVTHHPLRHGALWRLDLLASHQLGTPLGIAGELGEVLADGAFDVVHFHNVSLIGGPAVLALGSGLKLCTLHDYWFVCPMHTLWRMDREACERRTCLRCTLHGRRPPQLWRSMGKIGRYSRHVDAFIAPSDFSRRLHSAEDLRAPIVELPNFAPPPAPIASSEGGAGDRPYYLCVGRLERLKGVQHLVEAFRRVEGADLVIAGSGSHQGELERLARGLDSVRFVGWQPRERLDELYRGAVAVVVPSLCYESAFPLVGIEAFATGTPVVGRRIGALASLESMGGGWLFASIDELAALLGRLLEEPAERARQSVRASELYTERFSEPAHIERYLELIDSLEAAKGGS